MTLTEFNAGAVVGFLRSHGVNAWLVWPETGGPRGSAVAFEGGLVRVGDTVRARSGVADVHPPG